MTETELIAKVKALDEAATPDVGDQMELLILSARVDPRLRDAVRDVDAALFAKNRLVHEYRTLAPELARRLAEALAENARLADVIRDIAYNTSSSIPLGVLPSEYYPSQLRRVIAIAANAVHQVVPDGPDGAPVCRCDPEDWAFERGVHHPHCPLGQPKEKLNESEG
jgi:hypothetical protein